MATATVGKQPGSPWEREVEELFREHYAFMYRAARALLGRPADAEDVVQHLFLKFVQRELCPEVRKNPRGYLYRAAIHQSLNVIRSRNRRRETDGVEQLDVPEPSTGRVNDNIRGKLLDALSKLPAATLEILILRYEHGYTDAEIAGMLGHRRGKVAMILSRSRARLQELMEGAHDDQTQEDRL
jgi:RNA polymerase sigma-70 factor (ECF subfamily)